MDFVHARCVENECAECLRALLEEANLLGGLPLTGDVVVIPQHWLAKPCPHGSVGLKFEPVTVQNDPLLEYPEGDNYAEPQSTASDHKMDATKGIGYPVREHGPYGSHPVHDDFDDDSGPDGSGIY